MASQLGGGLYILSLAPGSTRVPKWSAVDFAAYAASLRISALTVHPDLDQSVSRDLLERSAVQRSGPQDACRRRRPVTLVVCPKNDFTFLDFVENRVDGGAPDKRPRVRVVMGQVVVDGRHQLLDATKDAPAWWGSAPLPTS